MTEPPPPSPSVEARVRFCSRCGTLSEPPAEHWATTPARRVCPECGMGVLLTCPRGALPRAGAPFVVVAPDLRITAVSKHGEQVLGEESELLGRPLLAVVSSRHGSALALAVERSLARWTGPVEVPVRVLAGRRDSAAMNARVSPCASPRGAVVAFDAAPEGPDARLPPLRRVDVSQRERRARDSGA